MPHHDKDECKKERKRERRVVGWPGRWCAPGCQRGLYGDARALRSALTAPRGGSMLREGTDPSREETTPRCTVVGTPLVIP